MGIKKEYHRQGIGMLGGFMGRGKFVSGICNGCQINFMQVAPFISEEEIKESD